MIIDVGVLVILLINVALGYRYGAVRRFVAFFGLFGGTLLAAATGTTVAHAVVAVIPGAGPVSALFGAFLGIDLAIVVIFELLGTLYYRLIRLFSVVAFDRIAGVAAGFILALFEAALLLQAAVGAAHAHVAGPTPVEVYSIRDSVVSSQTAPFVGAFVPAADRVLSVVLPSDLSVYFGQLSR